MLLLIKKFTNCRDRRPRRSAMHEFRQRTCFLCRFVIFGVNEPIKEFSGKIIAIIHRFDDTEEKWVVVPEEAFFSKDEIMQQVNFQEQFFRTEIKM